MSITLPLPFSSLQRVDIEKEEEDGRWYSFVARIAVKRSVKCRVDFSASVDFEYDGRPPIDFELDASTLT